MSAPFKHNQAGLHRSDKLPLGLHSRLLGGADIGSLGIQASALPRPRAIFRRVGAQVTAWHFGKRAYRTGRSRVCRCHSIHVAGNTSLKSNPANGKGRRFEAVDHTRNQIEKYHGLDLEPVGPANCFGLHRQKDRLLRSKGDASIESTWMDSPQQGPPRKI